MQNIGVSRNFFILAMAALSSIAPFSTDTYLPAMTSMAEHFSSDASMIQLSLTSFFIAFAFGQLIYGPLSEKYGRKKPLFVGLFIFTISSILCAFASSAEELIVWRFFQALGASSGVVISKAIITDTFDTKESVTIYSAIMIVMGVAPMIAPIFGGYINEFLGWNYIFIFLSLLGVFVLILLLGIKESGKKGSKSSTVLTYLALLRSKNFLLYSLIGGVSMGGMFAYITDAPFIFVDFFGFSGSEFAWIFALNALSFVLASKLNIKLINRTTPNRLINLALLLQLLISCALLVSFFTIGDSVYALSLALFLFMGSLGFIIANSTSLALENLSVNASYAGALMGAMQFLIAGVASVVVGSIGFEGSLNLIIVMVVCSLAGIIINELSK